MKLILSILFATTLYGQSLALGTPHPVTSGAGAACTPALSTAHCRPLTLDHTQMGGSTLTNFPFPVVLTLGSSKILNSSCFDVVFTSDSAGTTLIPWEQESTTGLGCNTSTGAYIAWVLCASCSSSVDTVIYVSYGNSGLTTAQNTGSNGPTHVWDTNFKGVIHMPNGTTLTGNDSTSGGNNCSLANIGSNPTATTGEIDGGMATGLTGYLDCADITAWNVSNNITIGIWGNTSSAALIAIIDRDNVTNREFQFRGTSGNLQFIPFLAGSPTTATSSNTFNDGTWHYLVGTYDGSTVAVYIDGVQTGTTAGSGAISSGTGDSLKIGTGSAGAGFFSGSMDEMEFSNSTRTQGWITATFNSQKPSSTFVTVGAEV